jgi:hypothetical protein
MVSSHQGLVPVQSSHRNDQIRPDRFQSLLQVFNLALFPHPFQRRGEEPRRHAGWQVVEGPLQSGTGLDARCDRPSKSLMELEVAGRRFCSCTLIPDNFCNAVDSSRLSFAWSFAGWYNLDVYERRLEPNSGNRMTASASCNAWSWSMLPTAVGGHWRRK